MDNQEIVLEGVKKGVVINGNLFANPDFIETNSAIIILIGDMALKILKKGRKALDCSTASARRNLLIEEMESTSEINADLYFGISPIFILDRQIIIGENDSPNVKAVDYALRMKRLEQKSLVRNILLNGLYSDEFSILIAKTIASFHRRKLSGEVTEDDRNSIRKFGTIESLMDIVERDFRMFEELSDSFIPALITEQKYQEIKKYIMGFLMNRRALLIKRIKLGYVLPVLGDFHSRNIFIENGTVYVIDRSLRKNMRVSDVVKDVAYFAVDLEVFGPSGSEKIFLDVYHSMIKDEYFAQLLPFYMCRGAFVAGRVNLFKEDAERLRAYFDFAYNYAVNNQL